MGGVVRFFPAAAFYLLALAAQVSGYTNIVIALALAGIGTALLIIAGWRYVAPVFHRAKELPAKTVPVPQQPSYKPAYDTNIQQAWHYMRDEHFRGKFTEGPTDGPLMVFSKFRQAASDGDLTIWGRENTGMPNVNYVFNAKPMVAIPREHWRTMTLNSMLYIFGTEERAVREGKTEPDNGWKPGQPESYWDLMVARAELEKLWPPKARAPARRNQRARPK